MSTIIDALVVTLGLDSSSFKKGQEETRDEFDKTKEKIKKDSKEVQESLDKTEKKGERTGKQMEASGKQAASFFSGMRNQIIALAGVTLSLKGLQDFMSSFSSKLNDLGIASKAFGMSAKSLDGWIQAGKAFGVTAQEIAASFSKISDAQEKLKAGRGQDQILTDIQRFSNMTGAGIDVLNDSTETVNRKIEANFNKLNPEQQRAFGQEFGRSYAWQQWSASGHSVKDIDQFTRGSGVNDAAVKAAERMRKAMADLEQTLNNIGIIIYQSLEPYLEDFTAWLQELADWMKSHPKEIRSAIDEILTGFKDFIPTVNEAVTSIGNLNKILKEVVDFLNILPGSDAVKAAGEKVGANKVGDYLKGKASQFGNWAYGLLGLSTDEPEQKAQSMRAPQAKGAGKKLLDWMGSQFSQLEQQFNLPPGLLRSVATTESGGNQFAVSGAGAKGLFQFMDSTAKDMGLRGGDVFDPEKSASAAAKYLSQLLKQTGGNLHEAIAAYNWGIGNVQKKGLGMAPEETRNYVPKVLAGLQVGSASTAQSHVNSNVTNNSKSDTNTYNIGKVQVGNDVKTVGDILSDAKSKIGRSSLATAFASGVSG
ncbi:Membrane-bound lytic murein transglycosylase D precursor [Serratia quinivorans]|uniref:lytic transglycosylase domain-containing protein n=1 Tax=Serratia quinivorans TaxID=137545 RepID=UPI00217BBFE9|nr:lytic transglycosylase domain-containing protein [Serratia quinivorans]CAI1823754.1 Membrane-bound lytic murein transglycosylase D precursor [Serratia quinivorans]